MMAGIFDTLAQVRMDQPNPSAEWAKQVEAANAKAAAIKAARGAVPASAPANGSLYKAGRFIGKTVGRLGAIGGLGAMGFGMADQAAAIQADPESKPFAERALQVMSGADVTGLGAWMGRKLTGRPEPVAAMPAVAPAATTPLTDQPDYAAGFTPPAMPAGPGAMPAVAPMTAADIRGNRVPASGTGAFVNNRTGAVTNLDTREAGLGAGPMVDAATYDRMRGFAPRSASSDRYNPTTAAGSFFQAGATMKAMANTQARQLAEAEIGAKLAVARGARQYDGAKIAFDYDKLRAETAMKGPGVAKDAAEAAAWNERLRLASQEPDPAKRAALIGGPAVPAPAAAQAPVNMQPMPGDKNQRGVVFDPNTRTFTQVPVTRAPQMATAADFAADVKRLGSREAVLREYAKRNITPPKE